MTTTRNPEPKEGTMFFSTGETIPGYGVVEQMTDTGYITDGAFAPFVKVHPSGPVAGLVIFSDGTRYGRD